MTYQCQNPILFVKKYVIYVSLNKATKRK